MGSITSCHCYTNDDIGARCYAGDEGGHAAVASNNNITASPADMTTLAKQSVSPSEWVQKGPDGMIPTELLKRPKRRSDRSRAKKKLYMKRRVQARRS
jgi:hypothetical protein